MSGTAWRVRAAVAVAGAGLVLGLSPTAPARAQETSTELVDLAHEPGVGWLGTHHYGVFRGEARVGWLRRGLERTDWDGRAAVERSLESFVNVAGSGNAVHTVERVVYLLEAPQLLVEIERRTESQGRIQARRVTRTDGRFDVVTTRDGEETTGAVAALDLTLADELVTERIVAAAAGREDGGTGIEAIAVALDLGRLRLLRRRLSVRGTEQAADGSALYRIGLATGEDTWSDPVVVDARGAIVSGPLSGGLVLRRMPKEEALAELGRSSLEVAERVPMDARLGDPLTLRRLEVSMPAPAEGVPVPFPETGRQSVTLRDGRLFLVVDVARDAGQPSDEDRAAALAPSGLVDSDAPAVRTAADRALVGTSRPAVRVNRLLQVTAEHLDDNVVMDEPPASELLRTRQGDCTEHTRLFVALCRAAGIPAREVTGLIWLGDEQRAFGWHSWAEVELAGAWRAVDPTSGRAPAHAAHLRVDPAARAAGALSGVELRLEDAAR